MIYNISNNKHSIFRNTLLLFLCVFACSGFLGGVIYYGTFVILCLLIMINDNIGSRLFFYNKSLIVLSLIILLSIMINDIEPYFKPWQRFLMLLVVLLTASPILNNRKIFYFRKILFIIYIIALSIISIASAILSFTGFGYVEGYLVGLSDFPNSLGYSLGILIILCLVLYDYLPKYLFFIPLSCIIVAIIAIPLTGTRTTLFSLPFIFLIYILLKGTSLSKIIVYAIGVLFLSVLFINTVHLNLEIINKKNLIQEESGESSRDALFNARINEFKDSPIIGIGTFRVDPNYSKVNKITGNVEGGNSFFVFLSMTGALGFLTFSYFYFSRIIFYSRYIIAKRKYGLSNFDILVSLVTIYNFIIMQQSAILLNAGLYLSFFCWLSFSMLSKSHK
jgi:O-antigen ligase